MHQHESDHKRDNDEFIGYFFIGSILIIGIIIGAKVISLLVFLSAQ